VCGHPPSSGHHNRACGLDEEKVIMKLKTTLIIFFVFIALLSFVLIFESRTKQKQEDEDIFLSLQEENIDKISLGGGDQSFIFEKTMNGDWLISSPINAPADPFEINDLARELSSLTYERIVDEAPEDLKIYGIPQRQISLFIKGNTVPEKILIGMENPLDKTYFAKKEGEPRIVLLSSSFKSILEKELLDFREKSIFKFKTDEVKSISSSSKSLKWKASKVEEDWFLDEPVFSLADAGHFDNLLRSLSNLRAKEFISENKTEQELNELGLDKPDFMIALHMPGLGTKTEFSFRTQDEKTYTTSSSSTKIVLVEQNIVDLVDTKLDHLRERKPGGFYSWEIDKVNVKLKDFDVTVLKDKEGQWQIQGGEDSTADREKIESFLRFFETAEATELVDPPLDLKEFGLDPPHGQLSFFLEKENGDPEEIVLFLGKKMDDVEQVYVKNKRYDYLFRISASFLENLPKEQSDWEKEAAPE
jgi:hypothetical protein